MWGMNHNGVQPVAARPLASILPLMRALRVWSARHGQRVMSGGLLLFLLADGEKDCTEIATALGLSKAGVTGLADGLAARGLVVRVPSQTDRRKIFIHLTPEGRAVIAQLETEILSAA